MKPTDFLAGYVLGAAITCFVLRRVHAKEVVVCS